MVWDLLVAMISQNIALFKCSHISCRLFANKWKKQDTLTLCLTMYTLQVISRFRIFYLTISRKTLLAIHIIPTRLFSMQKQSQAIKAFIENEKCLFLNTHELDIIF